MNNPSVDTDIFFIYNYEMMEKSMKTVKRRNPVAKDLRTPKYRPRVVEDKTSYKRKLKNDRQANIFYS
ncbi:MAG: hypothetical protein EBU90_07405 [Proteobacteria bacterium]|nr:hypothetical protein [Pseudomonadota bacterium]NBP13470.1 hypothetical protein [bacterium]